MHFPPVFCCARLRVRVATSCLALLTLIGLDCSHSYATFFNIGSFFGSGSSSPSIDLSVSDTAGPLTVDYDDLGEYNDLPTIKITEKLHQPQGGGELYLWSDVEIEICIDPGSGGSGIGDIFDDIGDILDDIFGIFNKKKSSSTSYSYSNNNYPDEPEDPDPWENGIDIGVKKYVKNKAGVLFSNYRMVLGTGVGDDFVPSDPNDGLHFLSSPAPNEITDYFSNPPLTGGPNSDYLHWTSDGITTPGLNNYQEAKFYFAVHVPGALFTDEDDCCDGFSARFTIRQHAEVPEPCAWALAAAGGAITVVRRRRRRSDAP